MESVREKSSSNIYRPDVEAFTKLWSSLRIFFEGTNVTKTIARLLHTYQPEDGIVVYAKLLRTLYVMLKKFDPKGFCTLASMVPPPKGASATDVLKTFYDATGHYRLNVPVLRFNNNAVRNQSVNSQPKQTNSDHATSTQVDTTVENNPNSNLILKKYTDEANLPLKKRKIVLVEECHFVKKEVSNLNLTPSEDILSNDQTRTISNGSLQSETEHQKTCSSKDLLQPIDKLETNLKEKRDVFKKTHHTADQQTIEEIIKNSSTKNLDNDKETVKVATGHQSGSKSRLESEPASATISSKKRDKIDEESRKFFHESLFKEMTEEKRKLQRAVRRDIRKMDHVLSDCEEYNLPDSAEVTFEIQDNLKHSLRKFLDQVQNGTTLPAEKEFVETESKEGFKKYAKSGNPFASAKRSIDYDSPEMKKMNTRIPNQQRYFDTSHGKTMKRKKPEPATRPRSERVAQRNSQNASVESKPDLSIAKRTRNVKKKFDNEQNNSMEIANFEPEMSLNLVPSPEMKTPAYKKQCYDTMMSIQTAKIAVANSLAISSVASYPAYPYYVNYFNHQRHMMHQPQFMMDPYCQNNWRYQTYGHYGMPQPAHTIHYGMNPSNHKYSMISSAYYQAMNSDGFPDHKYPAVKQSESYPTVCSTQENIQANYD